MPKSILIGIITLIVLAVGGVAYTSLSSDDGPSSQTPNSSTNATTNDSETPPVEEAATEDEGTYTTYSEAALAKATEEGDDIVLFFHAKWCPTCRQLERNLNAGSIPSDITILQLDYDTEDDFKQKYGVTFQHTLVQIDGNGNQIDKWAGSYDIKEIQAELG